MIKSTKTQSYGGLSMVPSKSTTNKRTFKHLTEYDRGIIYAMHKHGKSLQAIADEIGCHKSTISRELKRGSVKQMKTDGTYHEVYFPDAGQRIYEENRKNCGAKLKLDTAIDFIQYVENKILEDKWSPDVAWGYAKRHNLFGDNMVCTKTIYNYIEQGLIAVKNIDLPMKMRLNTKTKRVRKNKRKLGLSIDERPMEALDRQEFGHWEIDTVIGKKNKNDHVLLTLTERKTRQEFIFRALGKTSEAINCGMEQLREKYTTNFDKIFKTITSDNGSEFADLPLIVKDVNTGIYYTHPYSSFERGTNERTNGLIRRFIPKGKAISSVSDKTIQYVQNWCNNLPRKILGYRTPEECFQEELLCLST